MAATAAATPTKQQQRKPFEDDSPQSVEEAGALLGSAMLTLTVPVSLSPPPKGLHSGFATFGSATATAATTTSASTTAGYVPSSELFQRLTQLRSLLRSAPTTTPLVAAPSLLAGVLMKLLAMSSQIAVGQVPTGGITSNPASISADLQAQRTTSIPPMLSTPIRRVWVQCVVLCHSLGDGLSGNARINLYGFVRDMIMLAGLNPRTAKAQGGTRVAALQVISGVMEDPKLATQLASWAFDVIQLCQRALKSSGSGEPSYRVAAVETACSVAVASRIAFLKTRSIDEDSTGALLLKSALDDKAIVEVVKLLKVGVQDKVPEVRSATARLACLIAPMIIHINVKSSSNSSDATAATPTTSLEDVMTLAFKNLDDESADVAGRWAEALARCMSTSIEYQNQLNGGESNNAGGGPAGAGSSSAGRGTRKGVLPASACNTLPKALKYLVSVFIKVGGELSAPRAGGNFSVGGRAVRVGFARAIIHMLRLQTTIESIGDGRSLSYKEAILIILSMVGSDMEAQLRGPDRSTGPPVAYLDATTVVTTNPDAASYAASTTPAGRALFGQGPKVSPSDSCIARSLTSLAFRQGLSELVSETTQLAILHDLINLCTNKQDALKGDQFQVLLIEMSNLFATLGEATASSLEDVVGSLKVALRHSNHGVRHEAAVVCCAVSSVFPSEGRKLVTDLLDSLQLEHAELMSTASSQTNNTSPNSLGPGRFRFGRSPQVKEIRSDETMKHQYAIHGMALAVSMIVRDLPTLSGGISVHMVGTIMSVSEILISTYTNESLRESSPSGTCTCVRAGYGMLCGILTTGPTTVISHIAGIFGMWQKTSTVPSGSKRFTSDHEMICIESMLTSIVAFLKYCSELLLSIPDALSRTSLLLENMLPLFYGRGRLGSPPMNPLALSRLENAKASLLEAFSWLPPGSYPMVADAVFGFAASHIQAAIAKDVSCSILPSLISKEDAILDAVSFSRSTRIGQTGGAKDLETDIVLRTSRTASHGDRESAFTFLGKPGKPVDDGVNGELYIGSEALALFVNQQQGRPPTVLHEVGTWRCPVDPCVSSSVRLVDSAIQTFAGTFGLKSGKDQQNAMDILQSLLPPAYLQSSRSEQDRSGKSKDTLTAEKNIVAVLLSCVMALPLDESTHDIPVGLGPSWMNKASAIFLSILPSPSDEVRRAAAEGLGCLATLGVKEDMHFLQSSVVHSLDEIIAGSQNPSQNRSVAQDTASYGRSGGLLTLACMQRNTFQFSERRARKSRLRGSPGRRHDEITDSFPTLQIMIRLLPFTSFAVASPLSARSASIHALLLLLQYSRRLENATLDPSDLQLLKKATEIVEDSFLSAWTIASQSTGPVSENEKVVFEVEFLAVMLRLMTFLTPRLFHLEDVDPGVASRFSSMSTVIVEYAGQHPTVQLESIAFFEVLSEHQSLLPAHRGGLKYFEHPILCSIPSLMANITPQRSKVLPDGIWRSPCGCMSSDLCLRGSLSLLRVLSLSQILVAEWSDMKVVSLLFAALEANVGSRTFSTEKMFRNLAAPREIEVEYMEQEKATKDLSDGLKFLLYLERETSNNYESVLLRYILLARVFLSGGSRPGGDDDDDSDRVYDVQTVIRAAQNRALEDAQPSLDIANSSRWQIKSIAALLTTYALIGTAEKCYEQGKRPVDTNAFNPGLAKVFCANQCRTSAASRSSLPSSILSLHAAEILSAACVASTATVDQVELRVLQENAMHCLSKILEYFGSIPDPDHADASLLTDFIPQISASIKSSLTAHEEQMDDHTCRLFLVGCGALKFFVKSGLTNDIAVLKRVIRPALFSTEDVPPFSIDSQPPPSLRVDHSNTSQYDNMRSSLLLHVGKALTLGIIPSDIAGILEPDAVSLGIHCAALAIDGANMLLKSNVSICGQEKSSSSNSGNAEVQDIGFYFFASTTDVSDDVKSALGSSWALCAQTALSYLSKALASRDTTSDMKETCRNWLGKLIPFLLSGLNESIFILSSGKKKGSTRVSWTSIDVEEIACQCLVGIGIVASDPSLVELGDDWRDAIELLLVKIYRRIIAPLLVPTDITPAMDGGFVSIITKFCQVLKSLTSSFSLAEESPLLMILLDPLSLLQADKLDLTDKVVSSVAAASLQSVAGVIRADVTSSSSPALIKAMLGLLTVMSQRPKNSFPLPSDVRSSSHLVLEVCLGHESVTISERSSIIANLAAGRDWDAWLVAVAIKDGTAAEKSLFELESALLNPASLEEQLGALNAVRNLIQTSPPPNALAGRVASALGGEIIAIFRSYSAILPDASNEIKAQRVVACACCIKILVAAYQQFLADTTDEEMGEFLIILFDAFILALRFNGIPNHPAPQGALSEPTIGQMCAQTITHTARTSPLPFKSSMARMNEQDRALLEFAVRADMNGYVVAAQPAQAKKKLSLKGFKK